MIPPGQHDREESVPSCLELLVKLRPSISVHVVLDHLEQMRRRLMSFEQLAMMKKGMVVVNSVLVSLTNRESRLGAGNIIEKIIDSRYISIFTTYRQIIVIEKKRFQNYRKIIVIKNVQLILVR